MTTFEEVIKFAKGRHPEETLTSTKYHELKNVIIAQLMNISINDYEEVGNLNFYLLLLGLKFRQITLEEVDRLYLIIENCFNKQEDKIKQQIKNLPHKKRKSGNIQLSYFYKLVAHYFNILEDIFRDYHFYEHAKKAYSAKLHFHAHQKLFEHKIIDFFEYKRAELTSRFRSHYFLYTLIGAIGMIIFWRGIWDLSYEIPILSHPLVSIVVGLVILALTGFLALIGDSSMVATNDKFEE
jgi:hypothetical protein